MAGQALHSLIPLSYITEPTNEHFKGRSKSKFTYPVKATLHGTGSQWNRFPSQTTVIFNLTLATTTGSLPQSNQLKQGRAGVSGCFSRTTPQFLTYSWPNYIGECALDWNVRTDNYNSNIQSQQGNLYCNQVKEYQPMVSFTASTVLPLPANLPVSTVYGQAQFRASKLASISTVYGQA